MYSTLNVFLIYFSKKSLYNNRRWSGLHFWFFFHQIMLNSRNGEYRENHHTMARATLNCFRQSQPSQGRNTHSWQHLPDQSLLWRRGRGGSWGSLVNLGAQSYLRWSWDQLPDLPFCEQERLIISPSGISPLFCPESPFPNSSLKGIYLP